VLSPGRRPLIGHQWLERLRRAFPDTDTEGKRGAPQESLAGTLDFLMWRTFRRGVQGHDGPPDWFPDSISVGITAIEHLIGTVCSLDLGIVPMPLNEQVHGAPDVEFRNHGPICKASRQDISATRNSGKCC
jgi:hypothetical protein